MSLSLLQSMMVTSQHQTKGDIDNSEEKLHDSQQPDAKRLPQLLAELVDLVAKIAKTDLMIAEVEAQVPQDPGAEKWHEVSKQALSYSREALNARQREILESLKSTPKAPTQEFIENVQKNDSSLTTPSTSCPSPISTTSCPPGLEFPGPCNVVQELKDQYGVRSMRREIETLKQYPDRHVLIVRKIKALGFESTETLKSYFGQFGVVSEVIVPHSFTKPGPQRKMGRIRPGVMGFVVMETTDGAEAAIAHGEHQLISSSKGEDVTAQVVWFKDSYNCEDAAE